MSDASLTRTPITRTLWHYARPEFLYLSWAAMEVALIAPVAMALMPWARFWPPMAFAVWMILVILIPFNLYRLMSLRKMTVFKQQNLILLTFFIAVLLSMRLLLYPHTPSLSLTWLRELFGHFSAARHPFLGRDLLVFFLLSVLWWRGISLAGRKVDINALGLRVRVGALILAPIVIVIGQSRLSWSVAPFLLLFLFSSLVAIALTRAEQLELERTGQNYPMSPRWFAMVVGTSTVIVLLSFVIAAVVSGEYVPIFLGWLAPFWLAALFAGTVVFTAITYLTLPVLALLERIAFFINRLLGREFAPPAQPSSSSDDASAVAEQFDNLIRWLTQPQTTLSFVINRIILLAVLVIVAVLILLMLERYFSRRRMAAQDGEEIGHSKRREEDIATEGVGHRLLRRFGLLRRLRAASVRRLYDQMSRAAATHGYARGAAETPYEYLPTLAKAWPDGLEETRLITEAYVQVRYGEVPENRRELAVLRDSWRRLEKQKPAEMAS